MRFTSKLFKGGDTRIKSWFALLPVTIYNENIKETRWLERVTVYQIYLDYIPGIWTNEEFIDD